MITRILNLFTRRVLLILGFFVFILGIAGYAWWQELPNWTTIEFTNPNFTFSYPDSFQSTETEDEEESQRAEMLFRATEGELKDTPLVFTIQKEKGLRIAVSLSRMDFISNLLRNIDRMYPQKYSEFKKLDEKTFKHNGKNAAEIYFTYVGPAGEVIKQRFMIVEYDGGTALYVSAQTKESDFNGLNKKYFDRMFDSLEIMGTMGISTIKQKNLFIISV